MSNHKIDYNKLSANIYKKAYKLSDVKDRVEKVAFDVVRFKDGDTSANLWQIQSSDDGDYIVSIYNEDESAIEKKSSDWTVSLQKIAGCVSFHYKGEPIVKIATNRLGLNEDELYNVESFLPEKLATNKKLVSALLSELNGQVKEEVLRKYPELRVGA